MRHTDGFKYFVSYTDVLAPSDTFRRLEVGQKVRFCSNHLATGDNKATEVKIIEQLRRITMKEPKTIEMVARYDADTKRTHRFILEPAEGVVGTIYVSKEVKPLPKRVVIELKS